MFKSKWKRKLEESRDWAESRAQSFKNISSNAKNDDLANLCWDVAQAYADAARHVGEGLKR